MSADHIEDSNTKVTGASGDEVTLETQDSLFAGSVAHGVSDDKLDYGKLAIWGGALTVTVIVFVVALIFFSQYSFFNAQQNASVTSSYLEVTKLKADQTEELNSFGVVDLDKGVYRIPIEEAINKIAVD